MSATWDATQLHSLLKLFPGLCSVDVGRYIVVSFSSSSPGPSQVFDTCRSSLRTLNLHATIWPDASAANEGIQLIGQLTALQELEVRVCIQEDAKWAHPQAAGGVPVDLGPLGADSTAAAESLGAVQQHPGCKRFMAHCCMLCAPV